MKIEILDEINNAWIIYNVNNIEQFERTASVLGIKYRVFGDVSGKTKMLTASGK